ncbi:hypothetical protein ABE571_17815 [Stenotrophomonas sp. TWI273]|jgi:hypothetical protein|uniref:hypothetical protein n=1 Tax=unclassified Stenotrophomonas TaxID=196198 RepID=UPI00320B9732
MSNPLHPDATRAAAHPPAASAEAMDPPEAMEAREAELDTTQARGPFRAFRKAYRKARDWHCSRGRAAVVALRFALTGDSGRFRSHGGWMVSRIYKPR